MAGWWDHLLHTPMRDLAWYDWIAAIAAILMSVAGMIGGATAVQWGLQRWRPGPTPEQLIAAIKTNYAGQWVAVHGGKVVGHSQYNTRVLPDAVGRAGTTIAYVCRPEEIPKWAARFDREGRIGPNDEHETREEAERWAQSWVRSRGPATLMQRVDDPMHLCGVWVEVGPIEVGRDA
jgi:hypothetical protein